MSIDLASDPVSPSVAGNLMTGTLARYAFLAVNIALGIFLMPFTIRHLGTSEYGLWMLVASMTYYFQLLDLGYGNGVVRQVSDADARGDVEQVNRIVSTFIVVYAVLGLMALAGIGGVILWVIPRFPNLTAEQVWRAQVLLAVMGVRIAVGFPMTVYGAVTKARQRFGINESVAIVVSLVSAAVTYVVLASGHGLLTLVAATTSVNLASYAVYAWTARQAFPQLRIRPSAFNRTLVREVTTFSMYLFVIELAGQIAFNLDNIVIGAAIGVAAVPVYAVVVRLVDYQRQLCNQFNGLLFPVVVRLGARGRTDAVSNMLVDGTRIALTLVTGVTICLVGFGGPLLAAWLGPGFEGGVVPLYWLGLVGILIVGLGPLGNILLATGRHRLVAFIALAEALANLVLSLILVRRYGIAGVAAGTAIPIVIGNLFILLPAGCRQVKMRVSEFVRLVAAAPLAGAVPALVTCIAMRTALPPHSVPAILVEGAVVGLIYAVSVIAFGLDARVRDRYLDHVQQLFPSLRWVGRPLPVAAALNASRLDDPDAASAGDRA